MAYLLRAGDASSLDYVSLASDIVIPANSTFDIEFQIKANSIGLVRPFGRLGDFTSRCLISGEINPTVSLISESNVDLVFTTKDGVDPQQDNIYNLRRRPDGFIELRVNGVFQKGFTGNGALSYAIRTLFTQNAADQSRVSSDLKYLKVTVGGVLIHNYDPSASNGTGSTLIDTLGGNNGTLINFGASPWVLTTSFPEIAAPATTINYTVVNATITQARLTRGTAVLTLTSVTDTSAAVPALADNLPIIPFGTGAQLELWDGTEWLTAPIEFTQPVGQGHVTLAGTLDTSEEGYLFNYGGTPAVGDQFVNTNDPAVISLAPNGSHTATDGTYTLYAIDVSDAQPLLEMFTHTYAEPVAANVPVITVSGSPTTTIPFGGTLPVFTASTNDGSAVVVSGDTPVNNVAGTYVIRYNASNAAGAAAEVTRTVIVEAEIVVPVPVITVSGQAITTIPFGGVLPIFTATTNDGSPVVVSGDTPVNNVAGTYVVRFNASNAGGAAVEVLRTVIVEAQIIGAPSLFLFGGDVFLEFGVEYVEPGFQALDGVDGDITGSVNSSGTVSSQSPGRYRIDYSVTNSNNLTTTASRFVTVRNQHGQQDGFLYARRFPWQKRI